MTAVIKDNMPSGSVPCLGLAWSNLITTRIILKKCDHITSSSSTRPSNSLGVRRFEVIFSPELECATAEFIITENSISDVQ